MSDSADKLTRTRLAILEHLHRKERKRSGESPGAPAMRQVQGAQPHETGAGMAPYDSPYHSEMPDPDAEAGWMSHALHAVRVWWRYHPASMALDVATPMLSSYARRKPVQFLGIAAAAGALFMFARPWKLISVTGLAVAVLKSSQVSALVMSALSSSQNPKDDPPV